MDRRSFLKTLAAVPLAAACLPSQQFTEAVLHYRGARLYLNPHLAQNTLYVLSPHWRLTRYDQFTADIWNVTPTFEGEPVA